MWWRRSSRLEALHNQDLCVRQRPDASRTHPPGRSGPASPLAAIAHREGRRSKDRKAPLVGRVIGYRPAGAFLYQPVMTPTRWTMFWVRMIGEAALSSKSAFASVVRQMLFSVTGAAM